MKKILITVLAVILVLSLAACGAGTPAAAPDADDAGAQQSADAAEDEAEDPESGSGADETDVNDDAGYFTAESVTEWIPGTYRWANADEMDNYDPDYQTYAEVSVINGTIYIDFEEFYENSVYASWIAEIVPQVEDSLYEPGVETFSAEARESSPYAMAGAYWYDATDCWIKKTEAGFEISGKGLQLLNAETGARLERSSYTPFHMSAAEMFAARELKPNADFALNGGLIGKWHAAIGEGESARYVYMEFREDGSFLCVKRCQDSPDAVFRGMYTNDGVEGLAVFICGERLGGGMMPYEGLIEFYRDGPETLLVTEHDSSMLSVTDEPEETIEFTIIR